eukprot:scaffold21180_cov31-Tisochrysis_lutea.AAC.8
MSSIASAVHHADRGALDDTGFRAGALPHLQSLHRNHRNGSTHVRAPRASRDQRTQGQLMCCCSPTPASASHSEESHRAHQA